MTPFGERVRALRRQRGVTQSRMAKALGVSSSYLSALEHGKRGRPTWDMLQRIIGYLNVIWDDAEELERLAELSHPRIAIDTAGLSPGATRLANRLAESVATLEPAEIERLLALLGEILTAAEARRAGQRR